MKHYSPAKVHTSGFSLIEFMVALVLGVILIGGAVSVYLASKRSYTEVEQVAALSENGRFALQMLNDSLRHAGFFGSASFMDVRGGLDRKPGDPTLRNVAGDCSGDAVAYRVQPFVAAATASAGGQAFGCVTDAVPGTDVLVVRHVLPQPLFDSDPDNAADVPDGVISFPNVMNAEEVYVIANSQSGLIVDGSEPTPDLRVDEFARAVAWPYRVYIYYVRDSPVPTLSRRELSWNGSAMAMNLPPEDLVEGVENLRVMVGLTNQVTREMGWVNLGGVGANWGRVEAVEVFLLIRSATTDTDYLDEKTYQLGDLAITPASNDDYDERARRMLVHSTVSLRNPKLILRGGA